MKNGKLLSLLAPFLSLLGCLQVPAHLVSIGFVASGFEEVEQEFRKNFAERGEIGAALAIYYHGQKVVDVWGGYRDQGTRAPWEEDTLVPVFSTTKGMSSTCLAMAHAKGLLDYDAAVASYWPEFGASGKEKITVRQLLSHQAGLCFIDTPIQLKDLEDHDALAMILAGQKPAWEPGTKQGYHALSLGWYEGELLRRVDSEHRTMGRFFKEEVAAPLGVEFYIGLPTDIPDSRLAIVQFPGLMDMLFGLNEVSKPFYKDMMSPDTPVGRVFGNPKVPNGIDRYFLSLENPAYMGVGEARAVARVYGDLATGGKALGLDRNTIDELSAPPRPPSDGPYDIILQAEVYYSLGFLKPGGIIDFGSSGKAFGTTGAGGSFGFADPDAVIGYCYVTNKMGVHIDADPRERALRDAMYRCVKRMEEKSNTAAL